MIRSGPAENRRRPVNGYGLGTRHESGVGGRGRADALSLLGRTLLIEARGVGAHGCGVDPARAGHGR
jgi:hypothetical protein